MVFLGFFADGKRRIKLVLGVPEITAVGIFPGGLETPSHGTLWECVEIVSCSKAFDFHLGTCHSCFFPSFPFGS